MNGIFIGICITFTADSITIFIGIAVYGKLEPVVPKEIIDDVHSEKVLKHNNITLKGICDEWEKELSYERETMSQKVSSTQEELNKDILRIAKKQMDICGRIDNLIIDTFEDFEKYKKENNNQTAIENYLIFISNCYQLIRDFTLTLAFGDAVIEYRYSLSDRADKISKELEKQYGKTDLGQRILSRKNKSEEILENRQRIADYKEKLIEIRPDLEKWSASKESLKTSAEKEAIIRNCIPNEIDEMIAYSEVYSKNILELLEGRVQLLQQKKKAIIEESQQMGFFKKNKKQGLEKLSENYDLLILNTEKKIQDVKKEQSEVQTLKDSLMNQLDTTLVEVKTNLDSKEILIQEGSLVNEKYKSMIVEAEEKEKVLYKEYEEIIKDWPSMNF